MKKILLSAAALAVFMSATPTEAASPQSVEVQTQIVDRASALNSLCELGNDLRNCFYKKTKNDLYNAAKTDGLFNGDESNLKFIEKSVDNQVILSSGPTMKFLKKLIDYFEALKKGKDTSKLKSELTANKGEVITVLNLVMGKLQLNPAATTTIGVMKRVCTAAGKMYTYAQAISVDSDVLGYIVEIFNASNVQSQSSTQASAFANSSSTGTAGVMPGSTIAVPYTTTTPNSISTPSPVSSPAGQVSSPVSFPTQVGGTQQQAAVTSSPAAGSGIKILRKSNSSNNTTRKLVKINS